jgi:hypothetical protein
MKFNSASEFSQHNPPYEWCLFEHLTKASIPAPVDPSTFAFRLTMETGINSPVCRVMRPVLPNVAINQSPGHCQQFRRHAGKDVLRHIQFPAVYRSKGGSEGKSPID